MKRSPFVLVFLKAPRPGEVKTRLAAELGDASAVRIYRRLVAQQLNQIPASVVREIHFAPAGAESEMREWLGDENFFPQAHGDLGERLQAGFAAAFARGADSAMAIGGDCPGLTESYFYAAEHLLATNDVVLGPARDGGYTLIGLREPQPELFRGIPWSTDGVLRQTLDKAATRGLSAALLEELEDVDDLPGWERAKAQLGW